MSQILDNVQRLYVPMTNVDSEQKILEKSYSTVTSLMTSLQRNAPGMLSRPMQWQTQKLAIEKESLPGCSSTLFAWNDDKEL